jgi:hypothetical protein
VDLVPAVEGLLRGRGVAAARRLWAVLALLEQWPRLSLRSRHGFSGLSGEGRRAALESWRRLPLLRGARARLEALVREGLASAEGARSEAQPSGGRVAPGRPGAGTR